MSYSKKSKTTSRTPIRTFGPVIFRRLNGRPFRVYPKKYLVNWDKVVGSKFQFEVKQFFKEFWEKDYVCEEFCIQDKLRFDLVNLTKKVIVEAHGDQHVSFNEHFYKDTLEWKRALFRDVKKEAWLHLNGFKLVDIYPNNLPLDEFWIEDTFGADVLYG